MFGVEELGSNQIWESCFRRMDKRDWELREMEGSHKNENGSFNHFLNSSSTKSEVSLQSPQ